VIFSQFVQFLDLLEDYLIKEANIRISRIDGSVSRVGRNVAMAAFNRFCCCENACENMFWRFFWK
jgi:SNF2 family DNA or RNA helicase